MKRSMQGLWILATFASVLSAAENAAPVRGQVVFQCDFESDASYKAWRTSMRLDAGFQSARSLRCERTDAEAASAMAGIALPVEKIRGCAILVSARVRAENVSARPQSWNGIKLMLPIETPRGKNWPQAAIDVGTFDWRKVTFSVRVPNDASAASLSIGLEQVTGTVWFDDIRITIRRAPISATTRPITSPQLANMPRLRGAMISPSIDEAGLRTLGQEWGANLIRWQLIRTGVRNYKYDPADYDKWLEGQLGRLDAALPLCRKYGISVVVDLHSPPGGVPISGGYVAANAGLFSDRRAQEQFVEVWRKIAARYKGNQQIVGFDLVNEPVEEASDEDLDDWRGLAERAGRAVRRIDPDRVLIIEPSDWGGPQGLADFEPLPLANIIYSVHMYMPHQFTHQGVFSQSPPVSYPGTIEGKMWDRKALEGALAPAIEFQKKHGVPIYIGEFSVIRWAPGDSGCRYLKDLLDIFERNQWHWSYHAFREWDGWSVEHGPDRADRKPAARPTDRQILLREHFKRNARPAE